MSASSAVLAPLTIKLWYDRPDIFYRDIYREEPYIYQGEFMKIWNDYKNHKRVIVLAAGGTGKTKLLAAVGLFFPAVLAKIENDPKDVIILSGSLVQARNVYKFTRDAILGSPIIQSMYSEFRQSDTVFRDGSSIKALSSSLTSVQGQHGDIVIVDEAALVEDFQLDDCYRIIGAHDGNIVWSGTPTVYDSKFVKIYEETTAVMEKGEEKPLWEIWEWAARDCPRLVSQMEEAKARLPEDMWQVFWEGKPYPLTGVLIPRDAIVSAVRGMTKFKRNEEWKTVFGIDWGFGNPTALVIWQTDGTRYQCLECHQWSQTDFDTINSFIEARAKELSPYYLFCDVSHKGENLRLRKMGLPVFEVAFSKERHMLLGHMRDVFVKEMVKIPDEPMFQDLIYQLRVMTWHKKSGVDLGEAAMLGLKDIQLGTSNPMYMSRGRARRRRSPAFKRLR